MRIGLLCSSGMTDFNMEVMKPILNDSRFEIVVSLIDDRPKPSTKKRFIKNLKRGRGGYMLIMAFNKWFGKKNVFYDTYEYCSEHGIDVIKSDNPYSEVVVNEIKKCNLDVLVMLGGFGIVREPLLSVAHKGILSYHHGNMRKYRGQPVAFWELYNNEKEMGVTVQILSNGIDKGIPVQEKIIDIYPNDNVASLRNRAFSQSVDMMYNALCKMADDKYEPPKINDFGKNYTIPNLRQYVLLKMKLVSRRLKY